MGCRSGCSPSLLCARRLTEICAWIHSSAPNTKAWITPIGLSDHVFVLAPAVFYVAQWLQSFREFPPRQKPGSFNLDRVMEEITQGEQNLSN